MLSGMMVNLMIANEHVPKHWADNSKSKGKMQVHQAQSTFHEVVCNFDYKYSI